MASTTTLLRARQIVKGTPTSDGAGVKLRRYIGTRQLDVLDPFLMLDCFRSENKNDYIAGFPSHPHKGFSTVTIMKKGKFEHRDSNNNVGLLKPNSVQWMIAGSGIIHSEMPKMDKGELHGYQLWINLPAKEKLRDPEYQDVQDEDIPVVKGDDYAVRVMSGSFEKQNGAVDGIPTNPILFDVMLEAGRSIEFQIPAEFNTFLQMYGGSIQVEGLSNAATSEQMVVFEQSNKQTGNTLKIVAGDDEPAEFILASAKPLNEPVARRGPFVMSTQEELYQAFMDYQTGNFIKKKAVFK